MTANQPILERSVISNNQVEDRNDYKLGTESRLNSNAYMQNNKGENEDTSKAFN